MYHSADFLLVSEDSIILHTEVLSGHIRQTPVEIERPPSRHVTGNRRTPSWAAWSRAPGSLTAGNSTDGIYLAREDGAVLHIETTKDELFNLRKVEYLGHLESQIDSALSVLTDAEGNDMIITIGDMCSGELSRVRCVFCCVSSCELKAISRSHTSRPSQS